VDTGKLVTDNTADVHIAYGVATCVKAPYTLNYFGTNISVIDIEVN
jgi:hypothetical protein